METELRVRIKALLRDIAGEPKKCRGCDALLYWVTHANGRRAPYTEEAVKHDCPNARSFHKKSTPVQERRFIRTTLRYAGRCAGCEVPMVVDDEAIFDTKERKVWCEDCYNELVERGEP